MNTLLLASALFAAVLPLPQPYNHAPVQTSLDDALDLAKNIAYRSYFVPDGAAVDELPSSLNSAHVLAARTLRLSRVASEPMPGEDRYARLTITIVDLSSEEDASALVRGLGRSATQGSMQDGARVFVFQTDDALFHHHVSHVMARVQSSTSPSVHYRGQLEGAYFNS